MRTRIAVLVSFVMLFVAFATACTPTHHRRNHQTITHRQVVHTAYELNAIPAPPNSDDDGLEPSPGLSNNFDEPGTVPLTYTLLKDTFDDLKRLFYPQERELGVVSHHVRLIRILPGQTFGCGETVHSDTPNAYYCDTPDDKKYPALILPVKAMTNTWNRNILGTDLRPTERGGKYVPVMIMAHEFGHWLQDELSKVNGIPIPSNPNNELLSDCIAGLYTYQAHQEGNLAPGDIASAYAALDKIGDDMGSHGTSVQRQQAFWLGVYGPDGDPKVGGTLHDCAAQFWKDMAPAIPADSSDPSN